MGSTSKAGKYADYVAIFASVLLIGIIDHKTGALLNLSILYLAIAVYTAWRHGAAAGYSIAVLSSIIAFTALMLDDVPLIIGIINIIARMAISLFAIYLMTRLLHSLRIERKQTVLLQEANDQKNMFLGIAAHDLRNPISIIKLSSSLLASGKVTDDEQRTKLIESINESSEFMHRLVDDLLNISKIESGNLTLHKENVPYITLMRRVVELQQPFATAKGITLGLDVPNNELMLHIDQDKIRQVLNNLITNAIVYSPFNSQIRVKVQCSQKEVRTAISDSGPGISPDDADRIFGAFRQGKAKGTAGEKSTGLGLAIAKRITEGHGGRIGVTASKQGSTFFYTLPLQQE